uniref:NADH-ubiquinone oxidoreductase chain 4L n=1 Tax=Semele scabra TaxID=1125679 RepID=I6NIN0_9BIVA|nr:NADH dehydrogenase subunit 4L [Semele scabra]AEV94306.1 NADH dehydrogenase subunit 4L [Semele scabra]
MACYLCLVLFLMCLCLIFFQEKHFLSVLLVFELVTLSVFIFILCVMSFSGGGGEVTFGLVFLVFGVYEAANGLGLLVSRTRGSGVDKLGALFSLSF